MEAAMRSKEKKASEMDKEQFKDYVIAGVRQTVMRCACEQK